MTLQEIKDYKSTLTKHPNARQTGVSLSLGLSAEYHWDEDKFVIRCVRDRTGKMIEVIKQVRFTP